MIYAIGDIHGCKGPLEKILNKIPLKEEDTLVFHGDYIDRGPDSKGVIDLLMNLSLSHPNTIFLKGNHEWMFHEFYVNRDQKSWKLWEHNGAKRTIESYGDIDSIPKSHIEFIEKTKTYHIQDGYFFVHAGVKPGVSIEDQKTEDLLWIRDEFIYSNKPLKNFIIVFGHTPMEHLFIKDDKIGIDTGCVYGGHLSCIRLRDKKEFRERC